MNHKIVAAPFTPFQRETDSPATNFHPIGATNSTLRNLDQAFIPIPLQQPKLAIVAGASEKWLSM
jgi:hypothetical protein